MLRTKATNFARIGILWVRLNGTIATHWISSPKQDPLKARRHAPCRGFRSL